MAKKKLVVGAKVCVYRIPRNCIYWINGMEDLLHKQVKILSDACPDQGAMISGGWIVPLSCLKAL